MSLETVPLDELRLRRSEKWHKYPDDVLPSHIAEMDFAVARPIEEVLVATVRAGDLGYAHAISSGLPEAFASFAERRWGWAPDPKSVVAVPDVMVGVAELLRVLTPEDAGVVINPPVYPPFFSIVAETGRHVVEVPLVDGRLPLDGMRDALRDGANAVLLCNPQNPTGNAWGADDVRAVGELAAEHDALFLSDEIHAPLTMPGVTHVPAAMVADNAIILTSATKAWNLAGLKCGLAVGDPGVLARLPQPIHDRVGHLGILASVAAFADGEEWLDELRAYLAETRRILPGLLDQHAPGVRVAPAQATFLAWLDFRETALGDDPAAAVLDRGRLSLLPGTDFGSVGAGFARLNIGTSHELVEESVRRIGRALS
ncbi:MAG: MalY/PatB family protein [Gaiellaceae bacterium]